MVAYLRARSRAALVTAVAFYALLNLTSAAAQTQTAVEYYYSAWDHYFVTAFPDEILAIDGGKYGNTWQRTGQTFNVWIQPSAGADATCRFFSVGFDPKSSHFYTNRADECAQLKQGSGWQFEAVAFYMQPLNASYDCPAGTVMLFRLYNKSMGGAPNHRFTTNAATATQTMAAGWGLEGDGAKGGYACVPQAPTPGTTAEGIWRSNLVNGAILGDGTYLFLYQAPGSDTTVGFVQGNGVSVNGQFNSANARDFNFAGLGARNASFAATYIPRATLSGVMSTAYGNANFATAYDSRYEQPASLAAAAGTYSGLAASATTFAGQLGTHVTLSASGDLSGTWGTCSFVGTVAPHGSVNSFDLSLAFQGGSCVFGTGSLSGSAYYDPVEHGLFLMAINASRTDGFLFATLAQ